jgi:hypothetical protein
MNPDPETLQAMRDIAGAIRGVQGALYLFAFLTYVGLMFSGCMK